MASKIKIGVFYDGQYFFNVSNYYAFQHPRRARISINGLHNFIKHQASLETGTDVSACKIVDAHYFRGRLPARDANTSNVLYNERVFDDILMGEGVTTHYLPIKTHSGRRHEKGIDVWLALEAYELTSYKHFDILALIACDGDYVPLVRKINTLGTSVMLLSWDFEFTDENFEKRLTRTSQDLLEEVSIPIAMHEMIDNRVTGNQPIVGDLFVKPNTDKTETRTETYQNGASEEQDYTYTENYSQVEHNIPAPPPEPRRKLPSGATSLPHSYRYKPTTDFELSIDYKNQNMTSVLPDPDEKLYLPDGTMLTEEQMAGIMPVESEIHTVKPGFGFIRILPNSVFFHYTALRNCNITELYPSMPVRFYLSYRQNKLNAIDVEPVIESDG